RNRLGNVFARNRCEREVKDKERLYANLIPPCVPLRGVGVSGRTFAVLIAPADLEFFTPLPFTCIVPFSLFFSLFPPPSSFFLSFDLLSFFDFLSFFFDSFFGFTPLSLVPLSSVFSFEPKQPILSVVV